MLPTKRALALVAAMVLILLAVFLVNGSLAQQVFGLVLALALPGYTITQALLPRQLLGIPERIVLSVGVSLAVDALGGLALNLTPWGLQLATWSLLLIGVSVLFGVIAMARQAWDAPHFAIGIRARDGVLLSAAIVIAIAALTIARTPAPPQSIEGYTTLWVVPSDSTDQSAVRFGVSSLEVAAREYALEIKVNDQVVSRSSTISLKPGEQWEGTLEIPAQPITAMQIKADLYRLDQPQSVYRQVVLNRNK